MRFSVLVAIAALAAAPLSAQSGPGPADARPVIAAVLAHQASMRGAESAAGTCVERMLAGPPAAPGAEDPMVPNHAVRIGFRWHLPRAAPARPAAAPIPLRRPAAARAAAGSPLARRAGAGPGPAARRAPRRGRASGARRVDAALVPAPLRLRDGARDCGPLTLSAPAFAGETAFVETAYACGTTCGNGSLYALQRRDGRWEVVGVADIWIS